MIKFDKNALDILVGFELQDIEHNKPFFSGSGAEEIILHFKDGFELLIFVNDKGDLVLEVD